MNFRHCGFCGDDIPVRTEVELRVLALDISEGRVFTSDQLGKTPEEAARLLPSVFMPIAFLTPQQMGQLSTHAGMVFEHLARLPKRAMAINGMPMFLSFQTLAKEQLPRLGELLADLRAVRAQFLGGAR